MNIQNKKLEKISLYNSIQRITVKDLYTENYTALLKEIKGMNKCKQSYVNELEDLILSRCPYYPKQSRNSIKSLSVSPQCFFFLSEIENFILKFAWNLQKV